jgi:hypothetical protein
MDMNQIPEQRPCRHGGSQLSTVCAATFAICLIVGVAALAVCLADTESEPRPTRASRKQALLAKFNLKNLALDPNTIHAGGPDKDGIPSLTDPNTLPVGKAKFPGQSRIVVVTVNKKTRGYPLAVLNWHEAVNDKLGDVPIAVIYCPLCDSVSVVDRRIGKNTIEFGISGLLRNSNVLLYDRRTDALWSQLGLEAVSGPHVGKSLKHLPWQITTFERFAKDYPKADILSRKTGHRRNYARNPYDAYFRVDRLMFPVMHRDNRLEAKARVVGIRLGKTIRAYPLKKIRRRKNGRLVEKLPAGEIVLQADEDSVAVRKVPKKASVVHTFWFAWVAFHPDTEVYGQEPTSQKTPTTAPSTSSDSKISDSER